MSQIYKVNHIEGDTIKKIYIFSGNKTINKDTYLKDNNTPIFSEMEMKIISSEQIPVEIINNVEIHGDDIKLYPVPGTQGTISTPFYDKVWFEFMYEKDKTNDGVLFGNSALLNGVVTDASNIPYSYQKYTNINDMGRSWIYRYGAAQVKETLGYIRSKYSNVPIPGGEVTLNGGDLVSQGQSEKEALITQLREFLEKLTKEQMLTRQGAEATQQMEILSKVPLKIYIG